MQRYRIMVISALVVCLVAFGAIAAITMARGDSDASTAAALPMACENLVDATMLLAQHGSSATVPMSGSDPFGGDAQARSADTLQRLLDACDAELATMAH